ncbi:DUF3019 domain-containing protein [Microbulbifer agarilyticus]
MKQLWLVFVATLLLGVTPLSTAAELSITPSLCAIDDDEELCSISVMVDFKADDSSRYCLSVTGRGLVRCFAGNSGHAIQVYVTSHENLSFKVTDGDSGAEVAQATLKVAKFRPKRHQRRYGWGFL